jgi:hypothetical protein
MPICRDTKRTLLAVLTLVTVTGCASEISRTPALLQPSPATVARITVSERAEVTLSSGYTKELKNGSVWRKVGTLPQGGVYRIEDDVFLVEGKHQHEAYLVLQGKRLVGFYLPVESAFNPLTSPIPLSFK